MDPLAATPQPPYYAVIFTSQKTLPVENDYSSTAQRMVELAMTQPGYLGIEHVSDHSGAAITVSYWDSLDSIRGWQQHAEHLQAQANGKAKWYERYYLRVCRVERAYDFEANRT